jgi:hypothetical protein
VKYYKGLAGHYGEYVKDIFERFEKNKIQYRLDGESDNLFEAYFGKDPNRRKEELRKALEYRNLYVGEMKVSCSDHLRIETK